MSSLNVNISTTTSLPPGCCVCSGNHQHRFELANKLVAPFQLCDCSKLCWGLCNQQHVICDLSINTGFLTSCVASCHLSLSVAGTIARRLACNGMLFVHRIILQGPVMLSTSCAMNSAGLTSGLGIQVLCAKRQQRSSPSHVTNCRAVQGQGKTQRLV